MKVEYSKLFQITFFLLLFSVSRVAISSVCSVLEDETDISVCEKYTKDRSWITNVKKINIGSNLRYQILDDSYLYILQSQDQLGLQAVYNSTGFNLPRNSGVVGNGGNAIYPLIKFQFEDNNANTGLISLPGSGHVLIANLELRSPDTAPSKLYGHYYMISDGGQLDIQECKLEITKILANSVLTSFLSLVGDGFNIEWIYALINNNLFVIPEVNTVDNDRVGVHAISIFSDTETKPYRLHFLNNQFLVYESTDVLNKNIQALSLVGNFVFNPRSICNAVVDIDGNDLLRENHDSLLSSDVFTDQHSATGFTNGFGWGFLGTSYQNEAKYAPWEQWNSLGFDVSCNNTSSSVHVLPTTTSAPRKHSHDIDITTTLVASITTVVVALIAITSLTAVFLYIYKKNKVRSYQKLSLIPVIGFGSFT